jgi:hypothetical protein
MRGTAYKAQGRLQEARRDFEMYEQLSKQR